MNPTFPEGRDLRVECFLLAVAAGLLVSFGFDCAGAAACRLRDTVWPICDSNPRELSTASMAGRSGVFFEESGGFFSNVFRWQAMPVIGIENEAVGLVGGL